MKPWWLRAIKNGLFGLVTAPIAFFALMVLVMLGAIGRGASPDKAVGFFTDPVGMGRQFLFSLVIGFMGFFVGISSTPVFSNSPARSEKFRVLSIGIVFNTLIPPYLGTLISPTQGYLECLPLGLFIGLPLTLGLCSHLYDKALKKHLEQGNSSKD